MSLSPGTTLGHYQVSALIGEGGMGQVWQATDTQLNRQVALKILPDAFAADPDRLARFTREAQILASLNHPNIAAIHGIEEDDGTRALVLELVEGPTLADRIAKGPIPLDEALTIAKQIAEALEAAHEAGVIHRDLKPANIKVREDGTVKVLDFGLAKALDPNPEGDPSQSPTLTAAATQMGVIMGTAAYMSPEEARGKPVDRRTDLWAFGAVIYEMLTGLQAFQGEDVGDIVATVVKSEPDWSRLPGGTPPAVRTLVQRCLRKDRKQRLGDAGAARIEIDETLAAPRGVGRERSGWQRAIPLPWTALVAVAAVVAASVIGTWLRSPPEQPSVAARLMLSLPPGMELGDGASVAISPDGTQVAYVATRGGLQQLYLRPINGFEARPVTGTEGAKAPFFSPDGRWVGFFAEGRLKKASTTGGVIESLAELLAEGVEGGSWGPSGTIVFMGADGTGLFEVSSEGGTPRPITTDQGEATRVLGAPEFLPGGEAVLFTSHPSVARTAEDNAVEVLTIETGARRVLIQGGSSARYLPTGHLVFLRTGTLMAVPFDLDRLEITGTPTPVIDGVREPFSGFGAFTCSRAGTCVYVAGGTVAQRTVALVDRTGASQTLSLAPQGYNQPRFSPSGGQISFWIEQLHCDIVVYDLARGALTVVASEGDNHNPIWTHNGERITYISSSLGIPGYEVLSTPTDGSGAEERASERRQNLGPITPLSWSAQGNVLAFVNEGDIWLLPLSGGGEPQSFFQSRSDETLPAFSPDGDWLAYVSDESGRQQVYVQPFPGPGPRYPISTEGGSEPVWGPGGQELFFRDGDRMMVVEVSAEPSFTATRPSVLFAGSFARSLGVLSYDISPDGQTFVMLNPGEQEQAVTQIRVLSNWFTALSERVPIP